MLFAALVTIAALWTTPARGTFEFPDTNIQSKVLATSLHNATAAPPIATAAPPIATAAPPTRSTANARQINVDKISFMDDHSSQDYNPQYNQLSDIPRSLMRMTLEMEKAAAPEANGVRVLRNVLFSPASIALTLALVLLGSGGRTRTEVSRVLGIPTDGREGDDVIHRKIGSILTTIGLEQKANTPAVLTIATGVFLQKDYPIKERFQRISNNVYNSDILQLDFMKNAAHSGEMINKWVEWRTQGRIQGFLPYPPNPSTKVLLASALYFNGQWENPFPIANTRRRPFYLSSVDPKVTDETVEVTMMVNAAEVPYYSDTTLGCKVVTLPYKGGQASMHIILPNARGYAELIKLKDRITVPVLEALIANSRVTSTIISLPRMKLESAFSLRTSLETMGLRSLFDMNQSDLSGISSGIVNRNISNDFFTFSTRIGADNATHQTNDNLRNVTTNRQQVSQRSDQTAQRIRSSRSNPGLYADDVYHRVELEVTETGTVGSAVTATSISRDGSRPSVRMDRPFLFFIRHNASKVILFWGTILRPT